MSNVAARKAVAFEPVTLGHIRSGGSINCSHSATMNADHMPDETVIRALGPNMICTKCGHVGAEARRDWSPHVNKGKRLWERGVVAAKAKNVQEGSRK